MMAQPIFNSYGKMDSHNSSSDSILPGAHCMPMGPQSTTSKRASKRRAVVIGLLSLVLVIGLIAAIAIPIARSKDSNDDSPNSATSSVTTLCQNTLYPDVCEQSIGDNTTSNPQILVRNSVAVASQSVSNFSDTVDKLQANVTDVNVAAALADCRALLDDALENLNITEETLGSITISDLVNDFEDISDVMSTALTDQTTCMDGFASLANDTTKMTLSQDQDLVEKHLSIALALVVSFTSFGLDLSSWQSGSSNRGLMERHLMEDSENESDEDSFPSWVDSTTRRLLETDDIMPDVTVAQDGSGKFDTIQAAVNAAPTKSQKRYVIFVKAGIYDEQVQIFKNKTNITLAGEGVGKTIITGSLNVGMPGVTTFLSASLIVTGPNFIGRDFTVRNTAGAAKFQAVALRVSADKAVLYQTSIEAFQDTLYAHSRRQFYKDSTIQGTVDFIFGNGAVLFQTCTIQAKLPIPGQQVTLTAQGRTDPSQTTGLVFYNCYIVGTPDLVAQHGTVWAYLGRPWKLYSRTVYIRSYMSNIINPDGWLIWIGDWGLKTCYYAEYQNQGPGSDTSKRVPWSRQLSGASDANNFSINKFINGKKWLPATGIPYNSTTF